MRDQPNNAQFLKYSRGSGAGGPRNGQVREVFLSAQAIGDFPVIAGDGGKRVEGVHSMDSFVLMSPVVTAEQGLMYMIYTSAANGQKTKGGGDE